MEVFYRMVGAAIRAVIKAMHCLKPAQHHEMFKNGIVRETA